MLNTSIPPQPIVALCKFLRGYTEAPGWALVLLGFLGMAWFGRFGLWRSRRKPRLSRGLLRSQVTRDQDSVKPMRICYIVLVYHKFDQAIALIDRLCTPNTCFVVHVDKKVAQRDFNYLEERLKRTNLRMAKRERFAWGSFEGALAILNSLNTAIREFKFDRCVLLSGQDYPLKANSEIERFFDQNRTKEFIETIPKDVVNDRHPPKAWTPYYRFRRYHFWIGNRRRSLPWPIKSAPKFTVYHGATWWALTQKCVSHLVDKAADEDEFIRFFRTGFLVEEAFFHTLIMSSPFASDVTGYSLTYAKWTPTTGPHPKVLTYREDFEELMSSRKLFARKFDTGVDTEIISALSKTFEGPI